MHLVAVGGSDAGISAALRARELDPDTDVTVVVADAYPNFSICGIPYYISGEVTHWRNLAHRTQESAEEIHRMITSLQVGSREAVYTMNESQVSSEQTVQVANQAGERLASVTQRIGEIDGMNQSVATATEEQTSVIESLNMDIIEINTLNQEGVENLQATLRACGDLEQQAARLKQLVDSFRI